MRYTVASAAFGLMLAIACSVADASTVDDARVLLKQGKPVEAMQLLDRHVSEFATDVEFNYLLGIASLDAGKPGKAVFAFERALAIRPGHPQARAELARAYIALTEYEAARRELEQVRQSSLPPEVAKRVDEILALLDKALAEQAEAYRGRKNWTAYFEGQTGHDSNINTAPNATSIFIPALNLPGTLSGFSTSRSSGLLGLNGGIAGQAAVSQDIDVFGSADARLRYNYNQDTFNTGSLAGGIGARLTRGIDQLSVGLSQFTFYIDKFRNDDQTGISGQWQRELSQQDLGGLFAQYLWLNHPIASFLNTKMLLIGGTWTHAYLGSWDPVLNVIAYVGDDSERENDPSIGRRLSGAKIAGEIKIDARAKLQASAATQYSVYGGTNPFFLVKRKDMRYDLFFGLAYKPSREWTISPQFYYTRNDSNIAFDDFDRKLFLLTFRRDFN
jgi:outer membrane protein